MNPNKPAIDLSSLPPAIRHQVEAGLAKLPPEARQQLLEHGSPMLERAIAQAKAKANAKINTGAAGMSGSSFQAPHIKSTGHYNSTIMPGDRISISGWMLGLAAFGVAYLLYN